MSANEIKSFEDLWKELMSFFDAILKFLKTAFGGKVDVGATETLNYEDITKNW